MHNYNVVCFKCRLAYRGIGRVCARCNNICTNIGYRIRVPSKSDDKGWKSLIEIFSKKDSK